MGMLGEGRPSKLTATVKEIVLNAAKDGLTKIQCATCAGIAYTTLNNYLKWGKKNLEDGVSRSQCQYVDLYLDFCQAEVEHSKHLQQTIERSSTEDWKAAAWILERRHNKHFSKDAGEIGELKQLTAQLIAGAMPEIELLKRELNELKAENIRLREGG